MAQFQPLRQPPGSNSCLPTAVRAVLLWHGENVSSENVSRWCREDVDGCVLFLALQGLQDEGFDIVEVRDENALREVFIEEEPERVVILIMLLFSQIVFLICAAGFSVYLRRAWRRRDPSGILVILSLETWLLYNVFFDKLPNAYRQYVRAGDLHLGWLTFRPGVKPDLTWISLLLGLLGFAMFLRRFQQKKRISRHWRIR